MSMYNMLFGVNGASPLLLGALGLKADDVPRFRNCFIQGENIVIYTRTGGPNRDRFDNSPLEEHPLFVESEDDNFDCTYASFYFKFPEQYKAELEAIVKGDHIKPSEQWEALMAGLKEGAA